MTIAANAINKNLTILYVGSAHSAGNLANKIVSFPISLKANFINFNTYLVTNTITMIVNKFGRKLINDSRTLFNGCNI